ncbi:unnamed protein product [Aphanomyces euteiches]
MSKAALNQSPFRELVTLGTPHPFGLNTAKHDQSCHQVTNVKKHDCYLPADDIIDVHAVQLASAASATSFHARLCSEEWRYVVGTLQLAKKGTIAMAARSVLCHDHLLPLAAHFQGGICLDMLPLMRYVAESLRATTGIAHLEKNAIVSLYNGLLSGAIAGFRDVFRPRLEQYGTERLPRLLKVSPATDSFILVQAIVRGKVYQVEWMMGHPSFELCASYLLTDIAAWAGQLEFWVWLQGMVAWL